MDLKEARAKYKYIVAWCTMIHGENTYFIDQYLKEAVENNAPEDAVFMKKNKKWLTFPQVTNKITLRELDKILYPDKIRQVECRMTPLMPGVTTHRKYILCVDTGQKYKNIKEAALAIGVTPDYLSDCIRLGNKCKKMTWEKVIQ